MENENVNVPAAAEQPAVTTVVYASFWARFAAALIDAILVGMTTGVLGAVFRVNPNMNPFSLLGVVYYIFMTMQYGATLGKMALNLRVQNIDTGANLTLGEAILRELVGKFVSGIVFGIGYLWMIKDANKQTWHDKFAKSVVVKTK